MRAARGNFTEFGPRVNEDNSLTITFETTPGTKKASIKIFNKTTKHLMKTISMTEEMAFGRVFSVCISEINPYEICYLLELDGKVMLDPYCTAVTGRDTWADAKNRETVGYKLYSSVANIENDWTDNKVKIKPNDMIIYKLHMRGFTAGHKMSASKKGNFSGIISKIPYLKKLGITSVEFMPLYDFEELFIEKRQLIDSKGHRKETCEFTNKINYWGYGDAAYFAPKASYFLGENNACDNLRKMISSFHKNNMLCFMEMSFADKVSDDLIIRCLKFYVKYYHIDGFHILGCNAPIERIANDPFLEETKIFYEYISEEILAKESGNKHLFIYNDSFMDVTRQIQNHMNGSMVQFANHMRRQNSAYGFVNYMANVCGFSLWDSYSYGEKHNLANGEDNRDGTNSNFSFNYGVEGPTKNKAINSSRFREMRNALAALMLSQSVPLIVAADEWAASHDGNNNPYCQDNAVGYTMFTKSKNKNINFDFLCKLIEFRKAHKCIRSESPFTMSDYNHLGLPDMSFHGSQPWMMFIGEEQKSLGVLYNGAYASENEDVYICYNFHYDSVEMALPVLSSGKRWRLCANTSEYTIDCDFTPKPIHDQQSITVAGSSISILVGMKP